MLPTRGADRALHARARLSATRRASTRRSCAGSTASTSARCRVAELTARLEEFACARARRPRSCSRPSASASSSAAAISQEKIQTLADFWPLAGFLFEQRAREDAAASAGSTSRAWRCCAQARDGARGARELRGGASRRPRSRRSSQRGRRQARAGLPAAARRALGIDGVAGHLRERRGARPRGDVATDRRGARRAPLDE